MKKSKFLLLILVGVLGSITLTSCGNDDDNEPKSFKDTAEYREFFNPDSFISIDNYYDSEWKCTHIWDYNTNGNWATTNDYENLYMTENLDYKIGLNIMEGDYLFPSIACSVVSISYNRGNLVSNYRFYFAKRDIIVVELNNSSYFKYIRVK